MKKLRFLLIIVLIFEIGYFFYQETTDIVVKIQEVQSESLANILSGLKVVQISDLHIRRIGLRERRLINLINKIEPDIIFITGDFVSENEGIRPCI